MKEVKYIDGCKVTIISPDYIPEEEKRANEIILERLYNIFFHDK